MKYNPLMDELISAVWFIAGLLAYFGGFVIESSFCKFVGITLGFYGLIGIYSAVRGYRHCRKIAEREAQELREKGK